MDELLIDSRESSRKCKQRLTGQCYCYSGARPMWFLFKNKAAHVIFITPLCERRRSMTPQNNVDHKQRTLNNNQTKLHYVLNNNTTVLLLVITIKLHYFLALFYLHIWLKTSKINKSKTLQK